MLIEVNGEKVEVENSAIMEGLRNEPEFNAEIDRITDKRVNTFKSESTSTYEAKLAQLKSDHQSELEQTQKLNSGKASEQIEALMTANKELSGNFAQLKADLAAEKENGVKAGLKSQLATALAKVDDDLVRETLIENGMKSAVIGEDGKPYFNVGDGVMGGAKDLADQFSSKYPQHFLSNQPTGAGIKGGSLVGPALLTAALGGDMSAKMAYVEQHGTPAYLAEVEKAALKQT